MVKSKFPGKPSRLVQRTLVNAFSVAIPSCDTSAIAEKVCYGLSVFENTFGNDEDDLDFVGFSDEEIRLSSLKKTEFLRDVREKFLARGLTCSSSLDKKHIDIAPQVSNEEKEKASRMRLVIALKPEIAPQFSNDPKKERWKCNKFRFVTKKMNNQHHSRHGYKSLNKNSSLRFKHKPLASNYLSDKFRRKYGVPSRSVHSSRQIKSNKRLVENEKRNQKLTKQFLRNNEIVRNDVHDVITSDDKAKLELSSSKVIIREARLNISTDAAIEGPFSARKSISDCDNSDNNKEIARKEKPTEKERIVLRGPRIKHVCRSASSVLRTSLENLNEFDNDDSVSGSSSGESSKLLPKNGYTDLKTEKGSQLNRIRQCGDNNVTSIDLQNDELLSQHQGARCLQDLIKESSDESEESEDKLISTDFWEAYDPDEVCKTGFPLISSEELKVRALCFLCGSAGMEKLLYCVACCEPYHWYCAEGPSVFREETELEKCRANWICRKCKVCSTCGRKGDLRSMSSCKRCKKSYHAECLSNKATKKNSFPSDRPWVCPSCLKCKSCNSNTVFTHVGNIPLCSPCFKLRQKGNYCPLCQGCYQDEDYNVQMMECGICKCWIHAKCEGISSEKYQILSFLPDSIEFVCRLCSSVHPAQWWLAVEDELKAGFYGVLKSLCNNKKIGDLLKDSPRKEVSPCSCDKREGVAAKASITDIEQNLNSPLAHCKRALNFNMNNQAVVFMNNQNPDTTEKTMFGQAAFGCDEVTPPSPLQKCSSCYCDGVKIRNGISERILAMKANVRANQYVSVFSFNQQLENLLDELEEGSQDTKNKYREILQQFFPWFDAEHAAQQAEVLNNSIETIGSKEKNASTLNLSEDSVSQEMDEFAELRKRITAADEDECEKFRETDVRVCNFCKGKGDAIASKGGRLIYCGRNEWVHSNCALWSAEVFEEIDGSLQNVHSAISRGRQIRCSTCKEKGASVGCCYKNCGLTYHFVCAKQAKCIFLQNKTIYCNNHDLKQNNLQRLMSEKDFEILRPVYVEMDRKKKKLECHSNVKLRIGSLHVVSLGRIDPHLSDQPQYILPVNFLCKRLFWSTKTPWKIVEYEIQIKVSYSHQENNDTDINYTVDHSLTTLEVVEKPVDDSSSPSCCLPSDMPKILGKLPLPSIQNKSKRKIDFDHFSPTSKKMKRLRENKYEKRYLSAGRLDHVVIDYGVAPMIKKLVQLDGMIDMFGDEEPVTCAQCQLTYRTTFSYERHLETCNADFSDFMISSCESDSVSSEEEKISAFGNCIKRTSSLENSSIPEMAPVDVTTFVDKYADTYVIANNEKLTTGIPNFTNNVPTNINVNSAAFYPCAAMTYEDAQLMNNAHSMSNTTVTLLQNVKRGDTLSVVPGPQPITLQPTLAAEPTIKFNFVDNGNKITNYNTQFTPQSYSIQNVTSTPTYVIHQPQYQKPTMAGVIPTFLAVDNGSQSLQQIQYQSFQPTVVPTILGTAIVQPNLIETTAPTTTYIVNAASTPTVDLYGTQHQNMILPNPQPMLFGMETMVSNTVMSSSHQFMAQSLGGNANIGSSTLYSTTTTQVFQAAKQLPSQAQQPDLTSGYIVLNTPAVPQTQTSIQTIQTAPTTLQEVQQRVEQPQISVVSDSPTKYVYLQISNDCCGAVSQATPAKKLPPVIVKPAVKQSLPDKKNTKVMKVRNNRPIAIQTADHVIPLNTKQVDKRPEGMTMNSAAPKVKNLQIKTTDKSLICGKSGLDAAKIKPKKSSFFDGGEAKAPDENRSIKCAPAAVNGRSMVGLSCLSVDAPKVAKIADCGPLPSGVTEVFNNGSSCSEKISLSMSLPFVGNSTNVHKLEERSTAVQPNKSVMPTLKESKIEEERKKSLPIIPTASGDGTMTTVNGRKVVDSGLSTSSNTSFVRGDGRKEGASAVLNGKRLPSFSKMTSHIIPNLHREMNPVSLNGRSMENDLSQTPTKKVVEEKRSAPSMPILDFQLDEVNLPNEESASKLQCTATSSPSRTIIEPARKKYELKIPVCKTPETPSKNMPLLESPTLSTSESPTQATSISESDKIFDDLVRQYKLTEQLKAAAAKERQSLTENTPSPIKSSVEKVNLVETKNTADEIVENKFSIKRSPSVPKMDEEEVDKSTVENKSWKTASISYEVKAEDGFTYKTNDLHDLWKKILESVQHSRNECKLPLLPKNALVNAESVYSLLGLENNASKYLLEQLPDAWKCIFYKPVFHKTPIYGKTSSPVENVSGCARTEPFTNSHKFDMFGWLASRHRKPPRFMMVSESDIVNGNRRITSLNLPMAMRFRHLKETAKQTVGVFRSDIHGRGLFCLRDIDPGEMVVEYAGEVIRSTLTDKREKYYTSKGIGCYMFRIDDKYVVDATMCGNAARFINHSCDPNCYSRIVDILGKKHILIFALRRIPKGEELTYDYKFPLEEDKIHCHCLARKCRKYLN